MGVSGGPNQRHQFCGGGHRRSSGLQFVGVDGVPVVGVGRVELGASEDIILFFFYDSWLSLGQYCAFSVLGALLQILTQLPMIIVCLVFCRLFSGIDILPYFVLLVYCLVCGG